MLTVKMLLVVAIYYDKCYGFITLVKEKFCCVGVATLICIEVRGSWHYLVLRWVPFL